MANSSFLDLASYRLIQTGTEQAPIEESEVGEQYDGQISLLVAQSGLAVT